MRRDRPTVQNPREWGSIIRAIQGNFDHLMGLIRSFGKAHNALVDDVQEILESVEGNLETVALLEAAAASGDVVDHAHDGSGSDGGSLAGLHPSGFSFPGDEGEQGPMGPPGLRGIDGTSGTIGRDGVVGTPGEDGEPGPPGPPGPAGTGTPGADGAASTAPGPPGSQGDDGEPGPMGPQGVAGSSGSAGAAGLAGPPGPTGDDGETGPMGPQGLTGATGAPGGGGGSGSTGSTTLNFGAFPGAVEATDVDVSGQAGLVSTSKVNAWVLPIATAGHSADEHLVEALAVKAVYKVDGTLTIKGGVVPFPQSRLVMDNSIQVHKLHDTFTVAWSWT